MFKTFAAALVATSMVAGAAIAAAPSTATGAPPPAVTAGSNTKTETMPARAHKPMKRVSHIRKYEHKIARKHTTKHLASGKHHRIKAAHNVNARQTHKSAKVTKVTVPAKTTKTAKDIETTRAAGVQPAKSPASRTN